MPGLRSGRRPAGCASGNRGARTPVPAAARCRPARGTPPRSRPTRSQSGVKPRCRCRNHSGSNSISLHQALPRRRAAGRWRRPAPACASSASSASPYRRVGAALVQFAAGTAWPPRSDISTKPSSASAARTSGACRPAPASRPAMSSQGRMSSRSGGASITIQVRPLRVAAPVAAEAGVGGGAFERGGGVARAARVQSRRASSRGEGAWGDSFRGFQSQV